MVRGIPVCSTHSNSLLAGGGCSVPHLGHFTLRKNPQYPLYQMVGCPFGQSELAWRRADLLPQQGFEPAIIQPMTNLTYIQYVHSCQQKSIGLKFSKSQTGNDVRYSCHHNSSRFTFPIFAHSCRFRVLHSLQSITPRIY